LALELRYARALKGHLIAERSLEEMRRIGSFGPEQGQQWLADMTRLFPDVASQDRLTGVQRPGSGARFFHNGRLRGDIADGRFAQLFFGIWLAPATSQPDLRQRLLGGQRGAADGQSPSHGPQAIARLQQPQGRHDPQGPQNPQNPFLA
jgi:hypothetical protein